MSVPNLCREARGPLLGEIWGSFFLNLGFLPSMTLPEQTISIQYLYISPQHDFKGRHGLERLENEVHDMDEIDLVAGKGIRGDRYFEYEPDYKGQITFFDEEVWDQVKAKFALPDLPASAFRRNVVVQNMKLNELIGRRFALGEVELTGSEEAAPCYWMDQTCKPGVEEFLRGKGGLRCRIVKGGRLATGICQLQDLGAAQ